MDLRVADTVRFLAIHLIAAAPETNSECTEVSSNASLEAMGSAGTAV